MAKKAWRSSPSRPTTLAAVRLDELGFTDLGDSFEEMKIRAKDREFAYPYLYDGETQSVARAYGVIATPQVFIFDADRKLRYTGRFDDGDGKARQVPRRQERRRRLARRNGSRSENHPRDRLFDKVGRQGGQRQRIARQMERRAGLSPGH